MNHFWAQLRRESEIPAAYKIEWKISCGIDRESQFSALVLCEARTIPHCETAEIFCAARRLETSLLFRAEKLNANLAPGVVAVLP